MVFSILVCFSLYGLRFENKRMMMMIMIMIIIIFKFFYFIFFLFRAVD